MSEADGSRSRRTHAERSEAMRMRLLDAAGALVSTQGFARLRIGHVAARAGVSIGAQLHHFPTRNALVVALFDHLYRQTTEEARSRCSRAATVPEAVRNLIAEARIFFLSDSFAASLDIAIASSRDKQLRDQVLAIIARSRLSVEEGWVNQLAALGIRRQSAIDAIWIANSVFRGLAVRAIWDIDDAALNRMDAVTARIILADLSDAIPAADPS